MQRQQILARLEEVRAELAARGDDPRALRTSECGQLLAMLGEFEQSAQAYLSAALLCVDSGQALRASVLARLAHHTSPSGKATNEALKIWLRFSGEDESAFFQKTD